VGKWPACFLLVDVESRGKGVFRGDRLVWGLGERRLHRRWSDFVLCTVVSSWFVKSPVMEVFHVMFGKVKTKGSSISRGLNPAFDTSSNHLKFISMHTIPVVYQH
jgi:hypothetical protein